MIKDIREINFPEYATLEQATITINDMGDRSISTQVKIDGSVVPDFSYDWEVEFKGERYIHPVRKPQGTKDNASMSAKIDMVFYHWAIYEMKRHYFVEMASTTAGTSIADKYIASLGLNLGNFVTAFNLVLKHYFGERIVVKLNPEWQYDAEAQFMSISYSYIWDVLQQMHDIYGVRWMLKTNAEGVCEILMGYPAEEVSHIFEYGFEGGLLSVQRQVQSTDIRNRLLGRGGEKNLPFRYFKDKDPKNPLFEADPDWIPELANIAFTELRGKTFRDYVKGWKAKHYDGAAMDEPTEAYLAGYNAEKFDPTEYVEDKESIAKYGVLIGALENNSEIYPSIQGAPGDVDMIVDAEQVTDDDVDAAVENDAVESNIDGMSYTETDVKRDEEISIKISSKNARVYFSVPDGRRGTIATPSFAATGTTKVWWASGTVDSALITVHTDKCSFSVHEKSTGREVSRINIPPGDYYYEATAVVSHIFDGLVNITASISAIHLITSTDTESGWKSTFDIWVRNIWGSTRNAGETDEQYASRVWAPILGDRTGGEARVVFASGWLSFSSDWEFPIVGYAYDDSKEGSHWRLTLAKSEAELEASGKYIPYEGYNASAGDRFFFIGIDMPYQYVLWAEERLDNFKRESLLKTSDINPTWVIKTDKVRLNQDREGAVLVDSLNAGAQIRLASKQFISGAYETLYVQSMTYNWSADTILHPDVEIVVSDKVYTVKNPVAQMQGSIETLQKQVGSLSNIQQIIRQICDQLYLRKDGVEDLSKSPTRFLGKVTGEKFRQGQIGGKDWGIYRDESGKSVAEFDKLIIRELLSISELEINHVTHMGGIRVMSQAEMECNAVEEYEDKYVCFFDQKQGSKINLFTIGDIVWSQKFDSDNIILTYYKSVVVAIGDNYIELSKSKYDGAGVPHSGDILIQAGNITDVNRQAIIIIDTNGNPSISIYRGVNSFVFPDPETRLQSGNNLFTGRVRMQPGSDGLENILQDGIIGDQNMLRNSGFTGDYLSETLADEQVVEASQQMYSDPLDHWEGSNNVVVVEESASASGYAASMQPYAVLVQSLYYNNIMGEKYVFSFRAKGKAKLNVLIGGTRSHVEIDSEEEYARYNIGFVASESNTQFVLQPDAELLICELNLERGTVASAWGNSWLDNTSDRTYYQSMRYLQDAMQEGSTTIGGGLVLTNHIKVGNYADGEMIKETGGISGTWTDDENPAFWAGGSFEKAAETIKKYKDDPTYQPTDDEIRDMASFVVTHGGRAILNDMILRGYVYALGGKIGDIEIVDGGLRVNIDNGLNAGTIEFLPNGFIAQTIAGTASVGASASGVLQAFSKSAIQSSPANVSSAIISEGADDEYAFYSRSGMFGGLRPNIRKMTASGALTSVDHTLVIENTGRIEVELPYSTEKGQTYRLIHTTGNNVVFVHHNSQVVKKVNGETIIGFNEQATVTLTFLDNVWYAEFNS